MSRGFSVVTTVNSADELTPEKIADEVTGNGLLSAVEKADLLPGALEAAKVAIKFLKSGPFVVRLVGEDRTQEAGEFTNITVSVGTWAVVVAESSPESGTSTVNSPSVVSGDTAPTPDVPVSGDVQGSTTEGA